MKNVKKVELHVHLDGSVRPRTILELAIKDNIKLPTQNLDNLKKYLTVTENNKDLIEYLSKFELPLKVMQSKENLTRIAYEFIEDLSKENYIYVEVRFAPHLHQNKGLSLEEVVEAVLMGLNKAKKKYKIECNLLLCIMRHLSPKKGIEIVNLAKKYLNKGVVGIDLAGDEFNYSAKLFEEAFFKAKELNIPFTIHAGEARGAESIREAIELGAHRIGHGIKASENEEVMNILVEKKICLENCPISNYHTHAVKDFHKYPILDFMKKNILVSLNTDNRTVSDTNYNKEVQFLKKYIEINEEDIRKINEYSIKSAFISEKEKEKLLKLL